MSTAEGAYRCAECKSWRHLMAWAVALVEGPLNEHGELAAYDYVDDCGVLEEDSIHCAKHIDSGIELFQDGQWCRWWACTRCKGRGRVGENQIGAPQGGYRCPAGIERSPGSGHYWNGKIHKGWFPARQVAAMLSANKEPA